MSTRAARETAAKLCGLAAAGLSGADAATLLEQLAAVFLAGGSGAATADNSAAAAARAAARYEERDGMTAACGYVLAQAMTGASFGVQTLLFCKAWPQESSTSPTSPASPTADAAPPA